MSFDRSNLLQKQKGFCKRQWWGHHDWWLLSLIKINIDDWWAGVVSKYWNVSTAKYQMMYWCLVFINILLSCFQTISKQLSLSEGRDHWIKKTFSSRVCLAGDVVWDGDIILVTAFNFPLRAPMNKEYIKDQSWI